MRTEYVDRDVTQTGSRSATKRTVYRVWLDGPEDLAANVKAAEKDSGEYLSHISERFSGVASVDEGVALMREGWSAKLDETLKIAENAVTTVKATHEFVTFNRKTAIVGKRADLARFRHGVPECMVQMRPTPIARTGKIVTIVASIIYSGSLSEGTVAKRGQVATALALALQELGYATELWTEFTCGMGDKAISVRALVKGAHDVVDPARILFHFAHRASARALTFPFVWQARRAGGPAPSWCNSSLGNIMEPIQDFPEGTIYLPSAMTASDNESVAQNVEKRLRDLGILAD